MKKPIKLLLFFLFITLQTSAQTRDTLDLEGEWNFQIDRKDAGVVERWFTHKLRENINLPGSMLVRGKGNEITLETQWTGSIYDSSFYYNPRFKKYRQPGNVKFPFWLTPEKEYVGAAWYQKEVVIPENWIKKHVSLYLERAHSETVVWLDTVKLGMRNSMVAPHYYDLGKILKPGKHIITIRVDNRIKEINVGPDSHSITDHTQGNWNGIIGKLKLVATAPVFIANAQAYPNLQAKEVKFKVVIQSPQKTSSPGTLNIDLESFNTAKEHNIKSKKIKFNVSKQQDTIEFTVPLGDEMLVWDEFDPALYRAHLTINTPFGSDEKSIQFGVRDFKTLGTSFIINDRPVFLRGTLDNAVFPLTGYPPMDVPSWKRIFNVIKNNGLNHVRYHSWCPPEAAFIAADLVGIYLQPEGPSWANHGTSLGYGRPIDQFIYDETNRMSEYYGNYASFCMMAYGNEPSGKQVEYLTAFNDYWKKKDARRLYTGASVGGSWPVIPNNEFMVRGGARGLDWKNHSPQTMDDFKKNIADFKVPFVAHELGQYCVFPNFDEIPKYSGPYKALNFELFQEDLADHHMLDQAHDFFMASGKLQALCYKYDIERIMRTPNYSGYQLLSLSDYPGQGTALVGILDPFWDAKPYINTEEFLEFSNTTVPLAEIPKFVYTNAETFSADLLISHYGKEKLQVSPLVTISNASGEVLKEVSIKNGLIDFGLSKIGQFQFALNSISEAQKLKLTISLPGTTFKNHWNFWVYPQELPKIETEVYECTVLDEKAKEILNKGGKVLLIAAGKVVKGAEVVQTFLPVFWNTSWFQMRPPHTLGILIDPKHPLFNEFPTEYHSDLQWWSIVNKTQAMHLEDFPADFKPLIQPIDTWFMNRRLAIAFEAIVGNGKLMVISVDLNNPNKDAAARQLYYSLQKYMASPEFNPGNELELGLIEDLFTTPSRQQFDKYTKDSPDELKPGNQEK